jgi:hypothetical protein
MTLREIALMYLDLERAEERQTSDDFGDLKAGAF